MAARAQEKNFSRGIMRGMGGKLDSRSRRSQAIQSCPSYHKKGCGSVTGRQLDPNRALEFLSHPEGPVTGPLPSLGSDLDPTEWESDFGIPDWELSSSYSHCDVGYKGASIPSQLAVL
jgi:hypothetical protein